MFLHSHSITALMDVHNLPESWIFLSHSHAMACVFCCIRSISGILSVFATDQAQIIKLS